NTYGWLAVGVPGTLAGLQLALDKYGSQPFAKLMQPAIRWARDGVPVSRGLAATLKGAQARLRRDPGAAQLFYPSGQPLVEDDSLRNPELANLLQTLAERGSADSFYRGDI